MSGGYIKRDDGEGWLEGDHLMINISIKGPVNLDTCEDWDRKMRELKSILTDRMISITFIGEPTPGSEAHTRRKKERSGAR